MIDAGTGVLSVGVGVGVGVEVGVGAGEVDAGGELAPAGGDDFDLPAGFGAA